MGVVVGVVGLGDEAPPFVDPRRGVAASTLYNQIKAFFNDYLDARRIARSVCSFWGQTLA